jgi:hypothetical protein
MKCALSYVSIFALTLGLVGVFDKGFSAAPTMPVKAFADLPKPMQEMALIIHNAPNSQEAQKALCSQKSVIRGSGLSAGRACKAQDAARVALAMCNGFGDFKESKCSKNAHALLGANGLNESVEAIKASVKSNPTSNIHKLVCTGDETFKSKLPGSLKDMDVLCPEQEPEQEIVIHKSLQELKDFNKENSSDMPTEWGTNVQSIIDDLVSPNPNIPEAKQEINKTLEIIKRDESQSQNQDPSRREKLLEQAKKLKEDIEKLRNELE